MGRTGSSSKKKSSKKKIPMISSEARRRKRSRKSKSKKLRRDDDLVSYSDHESSSSLSVSSSSSEDDYRSRKSRSRTRDVKGSRKRARRSSSSRGSSVDSLPIKKKKHKGDSESRKKLSKKKTKKRRRDSSISSDSSDSHSCSTCQGGSGSDSERLRERSREKKKSKRKSGKGRSTRKRRDRSRSSSCSKFSDSVGNNTVELFAVESNSRRLRSVITVVTRETESEGNEENKDEFKEEIVCDHDDYPSCRSNDSNEAGTRRESAHRTVENVIGEEPSVSNLKASEPILTSKNGSNKYDGLECSFDEAGNVSPKEKEGDVKDLEVILRQRALENLKRFRGGHQRNEVVPADEENKSNSEIKPLSNVEPELVPNKRDVESLKRFRGESQINKTVPLDEINKTNNEMKLLSTGEAEFVQNNQLKQEDPGIMSASESALRRSRFTWRRDSSLPTGTEEKIPPKKNGGTDSAAAKLKDATLRHLGFPGRSEEKAKNVRPLASRLQTLPKENSSLTDSTVIKTAHKSTDEASQTLAESSSNTRDIGISDAHGSTDLEAPSNVLAEEGSSKEQQNDTKDGSQFEQKTMTVMRGGELVQVSYKVYIPKKVPALARRLKR